MILAIAFAILLITIAACGNICYQQKPTRPCHLCGRPLGWYEVGICRDCDDSLTGEE